MQESPIPFLQTLTWVVEGIFLNLQLAVLSILLGFFVAIFISIAKVYGGTPISQITMGYIDLIRGVPIIVVIFILSLGVRSIIPMDPFIVILVALVIRSSVYQSMAIIGALQSVGTDQMIAAQAVGFSKLKSIQYVVLPQALRFSVPAWTNEAIITLKGTALAYIVGVRELIRRAEVIATTTVQPFLWYGIALVIFVIMVTIFSKGLLILERRTRIPGFEVGS